jgi:perosamine synthetase
MIVHNRPTLGKEEEIAAIRVIQSGQISQGPEVESFENEFCEFLGIPKGHAVAVSNGTSALFLSLWALNSKNKKINFPAYVCASVRHAVKMSESVESIIDIKNNSPNIDLENLKLGKNSISIIPHMYGIPIDLTKEDSKNMIEDCAQSLGAKINNKFVGTQGEIGVFSFYATKLMTTGGQGGMIISKNPEIIQKIKDYREYDFRKDQKNRFNFQMTDIQAAIGREQLKKLPDFLKIREEIFQKYKELGLEFLDIEKDTSNNIHPIRYRAIVKTESPKKLIDFLATKNIESKIPLEEWELLGNPKFHPNSLKLTKNSVSLPIYPSLKEEEIEKICENLKSFFDKMN